MLGGRRAGVVPHFWKRPPVASEQRWLLGSGCGAWKTPLRTGNGQASPPSCNRGLTSSWGALFPP